MSNFSFPDIPGLLEPYLPPALQAYFTRQNLQALLRVVVAISTYVLFRPHLEGLFRKITGTPDRREEEARARLEFLRQQQQQQGAGGAAVGSGGQGKSVGIVGEDGRVYQVVPPPRQPQGAGGKNAKGGKKKDGRRKA
ncbi:hypothetical protein CLAIMM_04716 [Cladophialophora immunda]|nr:hypothetical protein CLAIMM_04716 [Cladophialophora immunda]